MREIVLIDDDSVINFLHKELIAIASPDTVVHEFQSSKNAFSWLQNKLQESNEKSSTIFLDINMPEMNGFEFLDALDEVIKGKEVNHYKIVMVSSSLNDRDRERALSYKMVGDYLEKPLTLEYLSALS